MRHLKVGVDLTSFTTKGIVNIRPVGFDSSTSTSYSLCEKNSIFQFHDVLQHPTLKRLALFRLEPESVFPSCGLQPPMLQRLELLDSEINPTQLHHILSVTQNLKELVLHSQDPDDFDELDWEFSEYSDALEQVSATLKSLVMTRSFGPPASTHIRLKNMVALERVAADMDTWFGPYLQVEPAITDQEGLEQMLREVLPPRLETMIFFEWREHAGDEWHSRRFVDASLDAILEPMFSNMRALAPALKQIDFDATRTDQWGFYPVSSVVTPAFRRSCTDNGVSITLTERDHFSPAPGLYLPTSHSD